MREPGDVCYFLNLAGGRGAAGWAGGSPREEWTVEAYAAWWRGNGDRGDAPPAAGHNPGSGGLPHPHPPPPPPPPLFYAQDWHLATAAPAVAAAAYTVPP